MLPISRFGVALLGHVLLTCLFAASAQGTLAGDPQQPVSEEVFDAPAASGDPGTSPSPAAKHDQLISTNILTAPRKSQSDFFKDYEQQIHHARELRREKSTEMAARILTRLLEDDTLPPEFKRAALFEMALVAQEENKLPRAQQILAQYVHLFPEDPSVPEVLLRQGLLYRQMGVNNLAISKYYAVMSSALKLKLDQFDYYKRLVLQAQTEIADTYYLQGKFAEAADFFTRLLKESAMELNKSQIQFKLIRSLSMLNKFPEAAAQAEEYVSKTADAPEIAEVRFLFANALKRVGRNREAMQQVLKLLEAQQSSSGQTPQTWTYWQQRAGNDIANQLYKEGDYVNALEIYSSLAELDKSPSWQLPAWYQIGLIYERLEQPKKADEVFTRILDREKELAGPADSPALRAVLDMAKWRKDHIAWQAQAEDLSKNFRQILPLSTNALNTAP